MRISLLLPAVLLLAAPALAQVTVDPRALDPLQPNTAPPAPTSPAPPARKPATPPPKPPAPKPASTTTVRPGVTPTPPQPAVPTAPPPGVAIPPPIVVPTRPAPPATPAIVTSDAPGTATLLPGGLRVTYGNGRSDLNPASETAIRALVRAPGAPVAGAPLDNSSYTITTYAAGTPEDPSTARRLSLSRALGVRSVLIGQGVPSVRIYVKALGPASQGFADGPADRADVTVAANPLPAPPTNAPTRPATPAGTTAKARTP